MILVSNPRWLFKSHFHSRALTVVVKCLKYVVKLYFGQETIWGPVSFSRCKNGVGFRTVYDWATQMKLAADPNTERSMIVLDTCKCSASEYFSIKQIHNCTINWFCTLSFLFQNNSWFLCFAIYNLKKKCYSIVIWSSFLSMGLHCHWRVNIKWKKDCKSNRRVLLILLS